MHGVVGVAKPVGVYLQHSLEMSCLLVIGENPLPRGCGHVSTKTLQWRSIVVFNDLFHGSRVIVANSRLKEAGPGRVMR